MFYLLVKMLVLDRCNVFWPLIYTLFCVWETQACICDFRPNKTSICSADFGLKAKVVSPGEIVGSNKVYEISPQVVYHLPDFPIESKEQEEQKMVARKRRGCGRKRITKLFDIDFFRVITAASEEECGISLMKDTVYMLTGKFDPSFAGTPKRLRVGLCDWVKVWDDVTDPEIVFISYPDKCFVPGE